MGECDDVSCVAPPTGRSVELDDGIGRALFYQLPGICQVAEFLVHAECLTQNRVWTATQLAARNELETTSGLLTHLRQVGISAVERCQNKTQNQTRRPNSAMVFVVFHSCWVKLCG